MSIQYNQYISNHVANVKKAFEWMKENIPHVIAPITYPMNVVDYDWQIGMAHDESKMKQDEYEAYDAYFYGGNRSFTVIREFNHAWLRHIHRNPHHWQYWLLVNDDPKEGSVMLDMDYNYIVEMICDWWSFSWASGDLEEIFAWYEGHERYIKMSPKTRFHVEGILHEIKKKLEEQYNEPALVALVDPERKEKDEQ